MVGLAKHTDRSSVSLRTLAESEHVPYAFAEQIVAQLKRAKLLVSTRGSRGGYRLQRPPERISVGEIVRALEDGSLLPCQSDTKVCPREAFCSTHDVWSSIQDSLHESMNRIRLRDLVPHHH
jgi:Rrf2 family protein